MITLDNLIIQSDAVTIITQLSYYLAERGINRFKDIKSGQGNIQVTCPFHKDGQERKPSFGIKTDDGKCHCFTCGWSGTIDEMISEILGHTDEGKYGRRWLVSNFNNMSIETRPSLNLNLTRSKTQELCYIQEEELDTYRFYHDYMYARGLTDEVIEMFDVGYDEKTDCLTFPVNDKNGNCLFVARRSVKTKYFNYPEAVQKPVYALDKCGNEKVVWIVESILNCLTCWVNEIPAVSLIGLGTKQQYEQLLESNIRHFVLALDPDEAGRKAQLRIKKALQGKKLVSELIYEDSSKDINDLGSEIKNLKLYF